MTDVIPPIRDFLLIEPDLYTAGQPTRDQIKWLGEQKFEVVINLATAKSPDAISDEQDMVMENGMAYVHIPVDWEAPQKEDLQKFFHFFGSYHLFKNLRSLCAEYAGLFFCLFVSHNCRKVEPG